ncbi:hypothetical protein PFICI_00968 [Pestalotiopsis fici W106-1]|uniref:D-3-phosphoglycerate dehydrogenase n=1 Tax=Pestalotiopsis fici (strain W106-1 / CGMCC3.15140) TaxID=1229662 RepID=W3XME9_PESFW|nr:uncharacterized protein PFICI_00968 [Pestalotiopsis fici W106-1]ETS87140.1 hypothetical protein PFICI_00968 [Pestalotiopsis fici W106-1]
MNFAESVPRGPPSESNSVLRSVQGLKVLLLEDIDKTGKDLLASYGYAIQAFEHALPEHEDVHVIGIRSQTMLNARVLQGARNLVAIGCFCIDTNQVDLDYATQRNIAVFNSPFSNSRSVAELIIGELVALARQLGDRSAEMHNGIWNKTSNGSVEIRGKKLGIIGYGHVGSQVSVLAEALGMKVIYHDIRPVMGVGNAQQMSSLHQLLRHSDFVTLHLPEQSQYMVSSAQFNLMKPGSYILNASRGSVVDIPALIAAMKTGQIPGAALDVYPSEPGTNGSGFTVGSNDWIEEIRQQKNIILRPHIGGTTEEAQQATDAEGAFAKPALAFFANTVLAVAKKLTFYINTGNAEASVNQIKIPCTTSGDDKVNIILKGHKDES